MNSTVYDPVLLPIVALKFVHPPIGMWTVFWGHRGQPQGGICGRLMCSHVHVNSGLKYVWCMHNQSSHKDQATKYRNSLAPVLDFLVKPGAKINQPWGKNRPALAYGKGCP